MKFLLNINDKLCDKCGLCIDKCPKNIITLDIDKLKNVNEDKCDGCSNCIIYCPKKALTISYE